MKCTNRLEKLILLATLLSGSVSIRADGTLPIPANPGDLPITLNGSATDGSSRRSAMEVSVDQSYDNSGSQLKSRCRGGENFYLAGGRVMLGSDSFAIKGICSPGATPSGQRQIIATSGSEVVQLDGMLQGAPSMSFNGQMKRETVGNPNAERFRFEVKRNGF